MSVDGGRVYWARSDHEREEEEVDGIVVVFGWVSVQERRLRDHVDLYGSFGWNCLVCCADFLSAFHPEKATALAFAVLSELIEKLRSKRSPIVLISLSGGSKACLYKVLQITQGTCEGQLNLDDNQLVRSCLSAHIYDSGPLDFSSDFAAQFALHPTILKIPGASKLMSWFARGLSSGLDALFLTRFRSQHAEYWQALYSSTQLGAPYLVLCSESDNLAPFQVVCSFAHRLRNLGGDVELMKWNLSPHAASLPPYLACAAITAIDILDSNHDLIMKLRENISLFWKGISDIPGLSLASDPLSPVVFLKLKASTGSSKDDLHILEKIADHMLNESSVFVVTTKRSFLDKCPLPVGIKLLVSAAHTEADMLKASEALKRATSAILC